MLGIILSILAGLSGCYDSGFKEPEYAGMARTLTAATAKKLKKQKNLLLAGTGGQMMDDIQMMMMDFDCYHEVTIEEARQLLVDAVEEYLFTINNNEQIRPFLHNYPFTAQNVEIAICFMKADGSDVSANKICTASSNEGRMTYYIDDDKKILLVKVHKETYDEAKKLVTTSPSLSSLGRKT
jgi:hypothetical protein